MLNIFALFCCPQDTVHTSILEGEEEEQEPEEYNQRTPILYQQNSTIASVDGRSNITNNNNSKNSTATAPTTAPTRAVAATAATNAVNNKNSITATTTVAAATSVAATTTNTNRNSNSRDAAPTIQQQQHQQTGKTHHSITAATKQRKQQSYGKERVSLPNSSHLVNVAEKHRSPASAISDSVKSPFETTGTSTPYEEDPTGSVNASTFHESEALEGEEDDDDEEVDVAENEEQEENDSTETQLLQQEEQQQQQQEQQQFINANNTGTKKKNSAHLGMTQKAKFTNSSENLIMKKLEKHRHNRLKSFMKPKIDNRKLPNRHSLVSDGVFDELQQIQILNLPDHDKVIRKAEEQSVYQEQAPSEQTVKTDKPERKFAPGIDLKQLQNSKLFAKKMQNNDSN